VELAPADGEARLTLANLLSEAGDPVAAAPHMAEALRIGGRGNFTALAVAAARRSGDQPARLLEILEPLLVEFPENNELMLAKSILLQSQGELDAALAQVQAIFRLDPLQMQATVLEAQILQQMGKNNDAFDRVQKALNEDPDNRKLRLQYARLLTRSDLKAARAQFQILSEDDPQDANLLYSLALVTRELGETPLAIEQFRRLLGLKGRNNEAHYYLGRLYETLPDKSAAIKHYRLVGAGQDFENAHARVAALLLEDQQFEDIADHFVHLRETYPNFDEALDLLEADTLGRGQELERSLNVLNLALEALPGNISLLYARSMLSERMEDLQTMESDLRAILIQQPDNSTALNALGYTLANHTDRYPEALELISRALELSPDEPAILDSMGWVKFHLGEHDVARDFLQKAFEAFPDPEVAAHLGEVLWALGETESARSTWLTSLEEHPDHAILLEVIRRLSPGDLSQGN
jgi:tetratricopeptide (TPR) repeat protein